LTTRVLPEAYDHLNDNGTFIVNAGRSNTDFRLVSVISDTMRSVFPNVYLIDTPAFTNTMVIGTKNPDARQFRREYQRGPADRPNSALVTLGDAAIRTVTSVRLYPAHRFSPTISHRSKT
jgi:spermidine synthase